MRVKLCREGFFSQSTFLLSPSRGISGAPEGGEMDVMKGENFLSSLAGARLYLGTLVCQCHECRVFSGDTRE